MRAHTKIIEGWSFRPAETKWGTAWHVYPKRERSFMSSRAQLYPASDGKSYIISMNRQPLDARHSFHEAAQVVVERLGRNRNANAQSDGVAISPTR